MRFDPQSNYIPPEARESAPHVRQRATVRLGAGSALVAFIVTVGAGAWGWFELFGERSEASVRPRTDVVTVVQVEPAVTGAVLEDPSRLEFECGRRHLALGRPQRAIPHFREAVRLDPSFADARYRLAIASVKVGDLQTARTQRRELESLDASLANLLDNIVQ